MYSGVVKEKGMLSLFFNQFIRIKSVVVWSAISFVGFILGLSSLDLSTNLIPLFVFWFSIFFVNAFTFAINNYCDVESDKKNPRRKNINAIASGKISKKTAIILNIIFILIPLIVTIIYKFEVFLFCIYLIFLWLVYSVPPFRLKGRPVFDVLLHFVGFFSYVLYGSFVAGSIDMLSWLMAISIGVWSCVGQVGNHISDYAFDKDSETKTFAVWAGLEKAKTTISILTAMHLIILIPLVLLYSLSYWVTIAIIIVLPIIGLIVLKPKKGEFPSKRCYIYFFTVVIGGAVYLSCLVYHIFFILGEPNLGILSSVGIP